MEGQFLSQSNESNEKKVVGFLMEHYGIKVVVESLPEAVVRIGRLRGKEMLINRESRGETEMIFTIAHLFGHMAQFPDDEKYQPLFRELRKPRSSRILEDFKILFYEYETQAYQVGKQVLVEALGAKAAEALDPKLQIYLATDLETVWKYLTTGEQISTTDFKTLLKKRYADADWNDRYPNKLAGLSLPAPDKVYEQDIVVY